MKISPHVVIWILLGALFAPRYWFAPDVKTLVILTLQMLTFAVVIYGVWGVVRLVRRVTKPKIPASPPETPWPL